ncbi:MAG: hypothetical protein KDI90_01820 [Alphaproteobacteria bacterium]|nr:hypothetical protein [Alphaproteobacteria bacterium]MCB9975212.1 hypothetical protein [Rhodospirillales bacterium]
MAKSIKPSIAAIKREVNHGIKGHFKSLADEFGADNFDPESLSENIGVFFALAAHHPQEDIMAAFPSVHSGQDIQRMDAEARGWIGNDMHLALTVFGSARTLNISKPDMGYQDADFG